MKAGQYLTFKIQDGLYGVDIHTVCEIKHMQTISPLPDVPSYMAGVINLRDSIIPIMDLRKRLGIGDRPYTKDTCVIVMESDGRRMGIIVDAVNTVTDLTEDKIDSGLQEYDNKLVEGIGKLEDSSIVLLNIKNCFTPENLALGVKSA